MILMMFTGPYLESDYADRFIKETNLNIIKGCIDYEHVDSDVEEELLERNNDTLFTGLGKIYICICMYMLRKLINNYYNLCYNKIL